MFRLVFRFGYGRPVLASFARGLVPSALGLVPALRLVRVLT